ncbi:hypothetical protein [Nostoc sp. DSM 114160]
MRKNKVPVFGEHQTMRVNSLTKPMFHKGQTIRFVGGTGIIRDYQFQSGTWNYLVEMEMEPELEVGRIGYETTIWLSEVDIASLNQS